MGEDSLPLPGGEEQTPEAASAILDAALLLASTFAVGTRQLRKTH